MKKLFFAVFVLVFAIGCQKKNSEEMLNKLNDIEKRVVLLEKRTTAPAQNAPSVPEQTEAYDIPVGDSYVLGNSKAPVTLTVFSDIQCPFCEKAHEALVEKIKDDPETKDKVKVVFKHFPLSFHKNAKDASKATLAAGEQGPDCFWKYSRLLFANQRDLSPENYVKWAGEIECLQNGANAKMNVNRFKEDLKNNDKKYEDMIKADMDVGMNKAFVRGTPSLFVNGWKLPARSIDGIKQIMKDKNLVK
jgi:protein-disulfide isomerase